MIRPIGRTGSQPEQLPPPIAALRPVRGDGTTLWSVWGFDSYLRTANEGLLALLGWSAAELASASYWDFVHPDDQHPLVEVLDRAMALSGRLTGYAIRVLARDGGWHRLEWDVVTDRDAELLYCVGARTGVGECADDTDRRVVGTWARQGPAGALTWSDEIYAMFGIPVGTALTDALVMSRIDPRDRPVVERVRQAQLADSDAHGARFRIHLPDGTTRRLECTGRGLAGSGHPTTARGITIDVTGGSGPTP